MVCFERMSELEHEQVVFCHNKVANLKAIIAIHNTILGPALGGTRMWPFKSEEEALIDVLRLSRGMTYKAALAGLNLGGGKAVIIGNPKKDKTENLFRAFGRFVESLGGRYITAEDVGTTVQDMEYVFMETKHVTGVAMTRGGSGDPSPFTASGVYHGIRACVKEKMKRDDLEGLRVAVQGVGHVGYHLVKNLTEAGAKCIVTDIDKDKIERVVDEFKTENVEPDEIYGVDAEIFAPCALGAVINDKTIPMLKCQIVAGGANNQLAEERHGDVLHERGILYAPDYVINAGGLINVSIELEGYVRERALKKTEQLYDSLLKIFELKKRKKIPTYKAADLLAEERIATAGIIHSSYLP
ncbi:MAG: Glu/Leu/Phe/Val dehydrogenase dimerization domain-containing protein [Candidatus Glassbacteria bacterium]